MKIHFASPNYIEPWDYRNVFVKGIGGSETSAVEMAIRLAARGHDVTSYTRMPDDCPDHEFNGVHWRDLDDMDLSEDGLWIIYRRPSVGKDITPTSNRRYWLVCQDVYYEDWKPEYVAKFDIVMGLCPRHMQYLASKDPSNVSRYRMSSNGVNVERIRDIEKDGLKRNPKRLIWASSPDRGLSELLTIFSRAREQVPDLELHCFYGMDNIYKLCDGKKDRWPWAPVWKVYERALQTPGVKWRGRIGQVELTREWFKSGILCYPTWFQETACCTVMDAQATGAIVITNPIWATGYNVRDGVFIEGKPNEPLIMARYAETIAAIASNPEAQEQFRQDMMPRARETFSWERWVDQWESWLPDLERLARKDKYAVIGT